MSFLAPACLIAGLYFGWIRPILWRSEERQVMGRLGPIRAAVDQFFLEFTDRVFAGYEDLVGPHRYIKSLESVQGEDYRALFPIRRDYPDPLVVRLSGGRKVELELKEWSGPMIRETLPDGRLIERAAVGPTPPPPLDGVQTILLPDGSRFEISYRGGVADGPFRAYYPDGKLWGEASYARGRVNGPCWLYTRDGRKLNELAEGPR